MKGTAVTTAEGRRRSSAQKRLRRAADELEALPKGFGFPIRKDPDDAKGVTAAHLRLVADLLDCPDFGEKK